MLYEELSKVSQWISLRKVYESTVSHPDGELFGRMEAGTKKEVLEEAAKECMAKRVGTTEDVSRDLSLLLSGEYAD